MLHSKNGLNFASFLIYRDLLAKNREFYTPPVFYTASPYRRLWWSVRIS